MPEEGIDSAQQFALLHRIAARDSEALACLYDQIGGLIFSLVVKILGDNLEAEEVVQDVFVQVWNKAETFNPAFGKPIQWCLGIARHRAIDKLRSGQKQKAHFVSSSDVESGLERKPEEAADREVDSGAVRLALAALPAEQRKVIELAFFNGLTHMEIAAQLNEPLGTIKAKIRRGMLKLEGSLQNAL